MAGALPFQSKTLCACPNAPSAHTIQAEFAEYGEADLRFAAYCTKEDVIQLMADRKLIDQALDCVVQNRFTV